MKPADAATTALFALFADPDSAQAAVNNLRRLGVADGDITVISSEPFEEYEFSHRDKPTRLFWLAGVGGAVGLGLAYLLTSSTQRAWPLQTGGMPIVATWPNLIIMFELTMLGGIVATFITLLVTAKLPRRRPSLYDRAVSDGQILVGVENVRAVQVNLLEQALAGAGGRVKTIA